MCECRESDQLGYPGLEFCCEVRAEVQGVVESGKRTIEKMDLAGKAMK